MIRQKNINLIKSGKIRLAKKSHIAQLPTYEPQQSSLSASNIIIQPYSDAGRFGWYNLRAAAAWKYYKEISVIRDAIDLGAENFKSIPFAVKNCRTDEMYREYDRNVPATGVINLLQKPNQDKSESEFKTAQYTSYQACGDTFMLTTAIDQDSEPLEIYYINPRNVSETTNVDEMATSYQINIGRFRGSYYRTELPDDRVVYINPNTNHQLWIMKTFNPDTNNQSRGLSKLASVFFELELHAGTLKHNNGLLRNGVRPSGALIPNVPEGQASANLSDEQMEQIKSSVQQFYGGYNNSGNVMVLDGIKEFKELSTNNKDMEYTKLLEMVKEQVYNNLNIPLPLISNKSMTFSNFEEAKFMLYDMNILPFSTHYAEEINRFLMPRFDDSGDYKYVVDKERIPALELRKLERIKEFKDDLTINERREIIDYEEIDGGDELSSQPSFSMSMGGEKSRSEFVTALMDKGLTEKEAESKATEIYGCNHAH